MDLESNNKRLMIDDLLLTAVVAPEKNRNFSNNDLCDPSNRCIKQDIINLLLDD